MAENFVEISDGEVDGESQDEIQERPSSDENTADNYVEPKRGGSRARRSKMPEIGAAPPVDLLSISTPPTSPPHQSRSHFSVRSLPSDQVQVQVPPVTNRWTYKTHRLERAVDRVLKEFKEDGDIVFLIRYEDGHQEKLSFTETINIPGGSIAIEDFEATLPLPPRYSDSDESDIIMVSTRPRHPKRARSPGFVDPTEINLSGDEDARGPKKRGRRPIAQSLISSFTERSESESASSDLLPASQRRRTKINLMVRNNRTSTRNQRGDFQPQPSEGSEDEEISEEESEESSYGGRRRRRTTNNPAVRRSGRAGRDPRSMAEILEDGIPEVITHKAAPKFVGAKESFKPLPRADDFRLRHCMQCETCGQMGDSPERGMLVSCQGCTFSYHVGCLGSRNNRDHLVTKIGDGDFVLQCRRCVENAWTKEPFAPHHSKCSECYEPGPSCKPFRTRRSQKEEQRDREENKGQDPITIVSSDLINNVKNVLFRCMKCYRAYHLRHLPSREELMFEDEDEEKRGETRFAQYCQDWFCNDCATLTEIIDGIIAWRPKNINTYNGQEVDELPEDEKEYLLKWQQKSYYQATWRDGAWVWGVAHPTMRVSFMKREPNRPKFRTEDAIPEDWLRVEIVFEVKYNNLVTDRIEEVDLARVKEVESARVKYKGLGYEDVVWEEPPDPEYPERWDDFVLAYNEWVRGHYVKRPPSSTLSANLKRARSVDFESKLLLKEQSKALSGGTLMPYQLEGVNWMYYQWIQEKNAILADEMGLGKTIQVIAFLQTLQEKHSCWPFLIVVPNATCANWRREIRLWAPSLRVCTFFGSSKARELSQHYELFPEKRKLGELACHVVVTSYDAAQDPGSQRVFKSVNWQVLVVDEGQRLKNDKNLLYASLSGLKVPFRLLLTGTPLQNNQRELFNLLQFSDTSLNAEALAQKYETITKDNVAELHELIKPFFLRRTKDRVLSLPPLGQVIVPVSMSKFQKEVYKGILEKDTSLLKSIIGLNNQKQPVRGLRNILMQLRKCLCHPYAVDDKIEDRTHEPLISHQRLVEASSKLQLLEIMLPKLKERGHRVLIFSQFLYMLTIIEDFLDGLGLAHSRLDGTMGSLEKQKRIDAYNAEDSPLFAFLLSTRAGGVGINLATADTVIILDPDFNPHQDLQAISRAHRIGQKNKVLVFQFMTRASAEEKIMQIGKKKMALDHVLIEQMEADEADVTDLEAVLRFGTEALFKDDDSQDITYDLASVDQLLDRSQIENTKTDKDDTAESQFSFARVWQNTSGTMREISEELDEEHPTDTDFWGQVIERSYMRKEQEKQQLAETFGRGKRNKKNVDYGNAINDMDDARSDSDFGDRDVSSGDESDVNESGQQQPGIIDKIEVADLSALPPPHGPAPQFKRAQVMKPVPPPVPSFDEPAAQWYCFACQFKNGPHEQGYCPLKQASVEPCRICNQVHFGIEGVCPALKSEGNIHQLNGALKNSTEEPYLVDMAKQYSNNSKAQIVKTKTEKSKTREEEQRAKIKRAQALASSGQSQMPGQPNQTPSTNGYGQRMQTNGAPNTPMNGNQNQAPQGYLTGSVPQAISSSRPSSATGLPQLGSFHSYGRMPSVYLPAASQLPYHSLHGAQT